MQLFYHATRDIELPRFSRRSPPAEVVRACEACGRALEPDEPSEGGARGLALCADCRARLDRSAIQIHFCDACGVSIPLHAVEAGAALSPDGRLLCNRCRATPPRPPRTALWMALAAVAALVLGTLLGLAAWASG